MSDHLDGITAQEDPRLDISDVYVFPGQHGTVMVMNTNPVSGTNGFHPEAHYQFKIDLTADAQEDLTLRVTFGDRDAQGHQNAHLTLLTGPDAADDNATGIHLATTTTGTSARGLGGLRFFAGSAGDPFYIEGTVVTAVRTAITEGERLDLSGFDPDQATNLFADTNVQAIVIEIPDHLFRGVCIGLWGAITVPTDDGTGWRQTDRAAVPLVSTLFGFNTDDDYNATHPSDDIDRWFDPVKTMIENVLEANDYEGDAEDAAPKIARRLLPDVLPYRLGTPAHFTPRRHNGRNLTDNTPEAMFKLILDLDIDMGLGPDSATGELREDFPYLALPVDTPAPTTHATFHQALFGLPPHPRPEPPAHHHP